LGFSPVGSAAAEIQVYLADPEIAGGLVFGVRGLAMKAMATDDWMFWCAGFRASGQMKTFRMLVLNGEPKG
jgi:hypothetical protein